MSGFRFSRQSSNTEVVSLLLANFLFLWLFFSIFEPHLDDGGDMVENYAWGITWSLGNNKHPPLFSWIPAVWFLIFPTKNWAYYLLNSFNTLIAGAFLYLSMLQLLDKRKIFIALALTLTVMPLSIDHGYKYNANLSQLPFLTGYLWALIGVFGNRIKHGSLIAGVMAGAAILCKYSAILILGPMTLAVWLYFKPPTIQFIKTLLIVGLIAFAILMPHIYWSFQHDWPSLEFAHEKHGYEQFGLSGWDGLILSYQKIPRILSFFSVPVGILLLGVLASLYAIEPRIDYPQKTIKVGLVIFTLSVFCTFAGAHIGGLKIASHWFITCTIFFGWAVVDLLPNRLNFDLLTSRVRVLTSGYFLIALVGALYFRVAYHREGAILNKAVPELFAQELTVYYHSLYHEPLAYVAGSSPLAYAVTFYSPDHPIGIYELDIKGSNWVDANDFIHKGKVIVCAAEKYFVDPLCTEQAHELLGQPRQQKVFSYNAYFPTTKKYDSIHYNVLIYR